MLDRSTNVGTLMPRNVELYIVYTDECWRLAAVATRTEEFYKRCFGKKRTLL